MPGKRKDQRLLIEQQLAKMVLDNALKSELQDELEAARANLENVISRVSDNLKKADLDHYAKLAASVVGRRGDVHFEMDPDGALVLVVRYGGNETPALVRDTFKEKAWNRQPKKAQPPPPPKGRGFIKTAPSISQVKVIKEDSPVFQDDLSRLFSDEPEPTPPPPVEKAPEAPVKRRRSLMRLGGTETRSLAKKNNPLQQASDVQVDLTAILKSTED